MNLSDSEDGGPQVIAILIQQYVSYVEMADRISQRRGTANAFFLSLHSGLVGLIIGIFGFGKGNAEYPIVGVTAAIIGLTLAKAWIDLLKAYRQLNGAKYKVVHDMEKKLSYSPYDVEWDYLGRGEDKDKYLKLTVAESRVPWTFVAGYLTLAVLGIVLVIRELA
ncbi:MAG: hypothetical protein HQ477_13620 [Chloroflexi bacterium]|nr:hypothetical protein [Chloroflexota bacterium]